MTAQLKMAVVIAVLTALLGVAATGTIKFSPDQCRVLRQMGVDTTGLCPPLPERRRPPTRDHRRPIVVEVPRLLPDPWDHSGEPRWAEPLP